MYKKTAALQQRWQFVYFGKVTELLQTKKHVFDKL